MKKIIIVLSVIGFVLGANFSAHAKENVSKLIKDLSERITDLEQRVSELEGSPNDSPKKSKRVSTAESNNGAWICEVFCIYKGSNGSNQYGKVGMGQSNIRTQAYKQAIGECESEYGSTYAGADIHFRPGDFGPVPGAADEESACYRE